MHITRMVFRYIRKFWLYKRHHCSLCPNVAMKQNMPKDLTGFSMPFQLTDDAYFFARQRTLSHGSRMASSSVLWGPWPAALSPHRTACPASIQKKHLLKFVPTVEIDKSFWQECAFAQATHCTKSVQNKTSE